jgi:hypothetical protein
MATQQQVLEFIRTNYKHEPVSETIVKLLVPLSSGRTQMVYAGVTEEELQVTSPVAWQENVSAERVLEANTSMFGIVSVNGAFGLKHNTFLQEINESEIEKAFIVLAVHADELEQTLGLNDEF